MGRHQASPDGEAITLGGLRQLAAARALTPVMDTRKTLILTTGPPQRVQPDEGYGLQPVRKWLKTRSASAAEGLSFSVAAPAPDVFPRPGPDPSPDPEPNPVPLPPPDPDPGSPLNPLPMPAPVPLGWNVFSYPWGIVTIP